MLIEEPVIEGTIMDYTNSNDVLTNKYMNTVWKYVNEFNIPLFDEYNIKPAWMNFCKEIFNAEFIIPNDCSLKKFVIWLKEKKVIEKKELY